MVIRIKTTASKLSSFLDRIRDLDVAQLLQASCIRLLVLVIILLEIIPMAIHNEGPHEVHSRRGQGAAPDSEQESHHDAEDVPRAILDVLGDERERQLRRAILLLDLRLLGREDSVAAIDEERDDRVGAEAADREDGDESGRGEVGLGVEVRVFWGYGEGVGGDEEGFAGTCGGGGD